MSTRKKKSLRQTAMVCIADSDVEVCDSIKFLLATENIQAIGFCSGQSLVDYALRTPPPNCIVTEALLPDLTGVMLLKRLREQDLHVPVIILASTSEIAMAVNAVKAGVWDYFEKPIVQRVLLDSVQRAIRHNRLQTLKQ